jgi:hypothetical protein
MNKLLAGLFLMASVTSHATDSTNITNIGASGVIQSRIGVGAYGGQVTNSIEAADMGDLRIVPSAIAPSINTGVICPMVMQGSKAGSVFFFSGSGTHAPDIVPICVAWHLGQKDVVEKMTCSASKEYAKANPNCGVK